MTDGQLTLTHQTLKTPRAAALAGILFAVLFSSSVVLIRLAVSANLAGAGVCMLSLGTMWVRTRAMPRWLAMLTFVLAVGLVLSIGSSLWVTLIILAWVCVVSVYLLGLHLRSPSASLGAARSDRVEGVTAVAQVRALAAGDPRNGKAACSISSSL